MSSVLLPNLGLIVILLLGLFIAVVLSLIYRVLEQNKEALSVIDKQIDGTTVLLLYILSFFIPLAGFIVGAIYASKEEEHYKHVGKNCLIFSTLNIVLVLFSYIMIASIIFA